MVKLKFQTRRQRRSIEQSPRNASAHINVTQDLLSTLCVYGFYITTRTTQARTNSHEGIFALLVCVRGGIGLVLVYGTCVLLKAQERVGVSGGSERT